MNEQRPARRAGARPQAPGLAARRIALEILNRVEHGLAYADVLLGKRLGELESAADRRLVTMLVLGTLTWRGRLDYEIERLASRKLDEIDAPVLEILRMGLFQIRFLDRIPHHAAVDTSVALAHETARTRKAAGLVNALLRKAALEPVALPERSRDEATFLAIRWSHPRWMVEKFVAWFGMEQAERLMAANNEAAPTAIRLNCVRAPRPELIARLEADGIRIASAGPFPETLVLAGAPGFDTESFRSGLFHVQSEASQMVVRLLAPAPGATVVDCAAAPGGKSTYLAELVGEHGMVLALDASLRGLRTAREVSRRLGHRNLAFICADLALAIPLRPGEFDFVLLDAPCTGTGTLREHPELRWRLRPGDPARLSSLQAAMLENAARLVRRGGALVYSVCSVAPEEGPEVINEFLHRNPAFAVDRSPPARRELAEVLRADGTMITRPDLGGRDGFCAIRLVRR